jgi:hypothetical protein
MAVRNSFVVPQGLKPQILAVSFGLAEAVPLLQSLFMKHADKKALAARPGCALPSPRGQVERPIQIHKVQQSLRLKPRIA